MIYKYRYLHENLAVRPDQFRAVLITGPRRSGKSTFSKELLKGWGGREYVTFDTPLDQARFTGDPEGFLRALSTPVVLDEVQNVPELFNYLKKIIDEHPEAGCDHILTGSQQFQMMRHVSESLAGRVLLKELFPFSRGEVADSPPTRTSHNLQSLLQLESDFLLPEQKTDRGSIVKFLAQGGFPPAVIAPTEGARSEWFNSYVETYVQRDIRALSHIQDLSTFSRFVTLVAGRTAQIVNYSELGKDIGVNYKTAQHYLSLLETSYLWRSLPPIFKAGSEKRLSKSPKGIFLDSGLAMFLVGLTEGGVDRNPLFGGLFESFVISELLKLCAAFGKRTLFCHFRAGERAEVDLVIEYGSKIIPIEIKCSASVDPTWGKGIAILKEVMGLPNTSRGYVISLAPKIETIAPGTINLPFSLFA